MQARELKLTELKSRVEIESFMGKWYVHGGILTYFEKDATDETEGRDMHPFHTIISDLPCGWKTDLSLCDSNTLTFRVHVE